MTSSFESSPSITVDDVIDVAVKAFSARGFSDTKLDDIAKESGMSKRMIHYHFNDKTGLYIRALAKAYARLEPAEEAFETDSAVPVEGIRKLIDALYEQFISHPNELTLLIRENLDPKAPRELLRQTVSAETLSLHLNRMLLLGQDSGAFRPGISAHDVFTLITSVLVYRQLNARMVDSLFSIDLLDDANNDGVHRMLVDMVLSFLTAQIPDSGEPSYLKPHADLGDEAEQADVYDEDQSLSDQLFGEG